MHANANIPITVKLQPNFNDIEIVPIEANTITPTIIHKLIIEIFINNLDIPNFFFIYYSAFVYNTQIFAFLLTLSLFAFDIKSILLASLSKAR